MDATCVLAGDCTAIHDDGDRTEHRGRVVVVIKPDDTVLVHDADGYQPVAWLTRADSVAYDRAGGSLTARDGDAVLRVVAHEETGFGRYPTTAAGRPLGDCPDCGERLVRTTGSVACLGCGDEYGLPADAVHTDDHCDCGLPRFRVERGHPFHVCLDRSCESIDEAVREAFDREWACPECGGDLRVLRRGGLIVGCERYPDCETGFAVPTGVIDGECDCGLPVFETDGGRRCLDSTCQRPVPAAD